MWWGLERMCIQIWSSSFRALNKPASSRKKCKGIHFLFSYLMFGVSSLVRQHLRQEGFKVAVRSQGQVISSDINAYIIDTIGWSSANMLEKSILNLKYCWFIYHSVWVSCFEIRCDLLWALLLSIFEDFNNHPCETCLRGTQEFLFFGTSGFCGRFSCPRPGWPQFSWTCSCRVCCSYRYYWMEWPYIW